VKQPATSQTLNVVTQRHATVGPDIAFKEINRRHAETYIVLSHW